MRRMRRWLDTAVRPTRRTASEASPALHSSRSASAARNSRRTGSANASNARSASAPCPLHVTIRRPRISCRSRRSCCVCGVIAPGMQQDRPGARAVSPIGPARLPSRALATCSPPQPQRSCTGLDSVARLGRSRAGRVVGRRDPRAARGTALAAARTGCRAARWSAHACPVVPCRAAGTPASGRCSPRSRPRRCTACAAEHPVRRRRTEPEGDAVSFSLLRRSALLDHGGRP